MKKNAALVLLLIALAPAALATVTPLPGVQSQTARVLSCLPVPIRFHVTDASGKAVGGARVDVTVASGPTSPNPQRTAFGGINPPPFATRFFSDQDGDTTTNDVYYALIAGTYVLHADSDYGTADVTVNIVEGARPAHMDIVGGSSQSIPGNTLAPQAFSVRVLDSNGQPFPRPLVTFFQFYHSTTLYDASGIFESFQGNYTTDIGHATDDNGIATTVSPFRALPYQGNGVVNAQAYQGLEANSAVTVDFPFTVTAPPAGTPSTYQDMWWGGDSQNGWGLSVIEHDRRMFVVVFAYDATGKPAWYVVPNATWRSAQGVTLSGSLYQPTASPYTAFDTNSVTVGPSLGSILVTFESANEAQLIFSGKPGGPPSVTKQIQRMTFGDPAAATRGASDMWWGGATQSGWGISVIEHTGTFFSVWYTYGADRKATWFVMPGGGWDPSGNYVGQIYTTTNPSWSTSYDPAQLTVMQAGAFTLHVDDPAKSMRFDYLINGVGGTLPLSREPF